MEIVTTWVGGTRIDERLWPIAIVTPSPTGFSQVEFLQFCDRVAQFHERGQRFCVVVDLRRTPVISADERRILAEELERDLEKYPGQLCGIASVVSDNVQRGVAIVLTWLVRRPYATAAFPTIEAAVDWARQKLAEKPPKIAGELS